MAELSSSSSRLMPVVRMSGSTRQKMTVDTVRSKARVKYVSLNYRVGKPSILICNKCTASIYLFFFSNICPLSIIFLFFKGTIVRVRDGMYFMVEVLKFEPKSIEIKFLGELISDQCFLIFLFL